MRDGLRPREKRTDKAAGSHTIEYNKHTYLVAHVQRASMVGKFLPAQVRGHVREDDVHLASSFSFLFQRLAEGGLGGGLGEISLEEREAWQGEDGAEVDANDSACGGGGGPCGVPSSRVARCCCGGWFWWWFCFWGADELQGHLAPAAGGTPEVQHTGWVGSGGSV